MGQEAGGWALTPILWLWIQIQNCRLPPQTWGFNQSTDPSLGDSRHLLRLSGQIITKGPDIGYTLESPSELIKNAKAENIPGLIL